MKIANSPTLAVVGILCLSLIGGIKTAEAKGALKGAVVGATAGHFVGHGHAKSGAVIGAIAGHHHAAKKAAKTS